ncbi:MarR family transcriptional regulator [Streptomyces sp. NPDC047028]|uniref:MarR family winged helix-turn-helix transcriptional regulator n=1 Tax=Streptomyces sp. NPDC047028 TaxID=3155793 RepID=UPI0033E7FF14
MTVAAFRPRPEPVEVARVTARTGELLEVLWGRASTAPASASQMRVLLTLEHQDGINLRTLSDALSSTPPSTSRLCDRLVAAGLVERVVHAADRREIRLHLSARGRAHLDDLRVRREQELQAVLAHMPAYKRTALLEGLEAFCHAAAWQIHDQGQQPDDRTA